MYVSLKNKAVPTVVRKNPLRGQVEETLKRKKKNSKENPFSFG